MRILFLDTAHRHLTVACVENEVIVALIHQEAFKSQSEKIMSAIDECFQKVHWHPKSLEAIVLTEGPGSYTGVRIAMTIAKTLVSVADIRLYTTTTLQLLAGSKDHVFVMLDARSSRAYGAEIHQGHLTEPPRIYTTEEISQLRSNHPELVFIGDLHLIGGQDKFDDIEDGILTCIRHARFVEDVDALTPLYLKSSEEYKP